jgi:hypothetical protein
LCLDGEGEKVRSAVKVIHMELIQKHKNTYMVVPLLLCMNPIYDRENACLMNYTVGNNVV